MRKCGGSHRERKLNCLTLADIAPHRQSPVYTEKKRKTGRKNGNDKQLNERVNELASPIETLNGECAVFFPWVCFRYYDSSQPTVGL